MVKLNLEIPSEFFREETRCHYTIPPDMKKVWAVELDLLNRFLLACEKHHLQCYADSGTLLGAVRPKGFIPWDDDIDLVMFRKDYDKMVKLAPREFEKPYFFQNVYSDTGYLRGHAQFRNSETTGILRIESGKKIPYNQGIFIDIFVLDGVTTDKMFRARQKNAIRFHRKMMEYLLFCQNSITFQEKVFKQWMNAIGISDIKEQFRIIEDLLRMVPVESVPLAAPLSFIFEIEKRIRKKEIYKETVWLPFEWIQVPAPAGYDEFLSQRYGDYKTPVQNPTTHGDTFFDTEKAYTWYSGRRVMA